MAIPKARKPKQRMFTLKEAQQSCEQAIHQTQLIMAAAIQDTLKVNADELLKILETSAKYAKYYDDHVIKMKDVAKSIYKASGGEIDMMQSEKRLRCQKKL